MCRFIYTIKLFEQGIIFKRKEVWRSTWVVPTTYTPLPELPLSTLTILPEHATHQLLVSQWL